MLGGTRELGVGDGQGVRVSSGGDENVLKWIVVTDAQFYEYTKNHGIVHFKWVN